MSQVLDLDSAQVPYLICTVLWRTYDRKYSFTQDSKFVSTTSTHIWGAELEACPPSVTTPLLACGTSVQMPAAF